MTTIAERTPLPHVLLVEDTSGDATLMKLAFRRADMPTKVTVAVSAEIAVKILRREDDYADAAAPDIILLDLNLPRMHGREFLAEIKADPILRNIPVVVLSSSDAEMDVKTAYSDFANGFVVKPMSLDDYDDVVRVIEDYWFKHMETVGGG